jgi:hypothetical protein
MSSLENGSRAKEKAAESTSNRAFPGMPILSMALVKPATKADPFVSFRQLILVESLRKPKQTPPKHRACTDTEASANMAAVVNGLAQRALTQQPY